MASSPPGRSSASAWRLSDAYPSSAASTACWLFAKAGGSRMIRSNVRPSSLKDASSSNTSAARKSCVSGGEPVAREVLARQRDGVRVLVDREDALRAAQRRVHREAAGEAEAVEHVAALREPADQEPVLALVEEEAGLLPAVGVDQELRAALAGSGSAPARGWPAEHLARCPRPSSSSASSRADLVAADDALEVRAPPPASASTRMRPVRGEPRRVQLQHRVAGVEVDDHAGQPVALAVDQRGSCRCR